MHTVGVFAISGWDEYFHLGDMFLGKNIIAFFIAAYRSIIDRVWDLCDIGSDPCMFYRKIIL